MGSGLVQLSDPTDDTRRQEFDALRPLPVWITSVHNKIHSGETFWISDYDEDAAIDEIVQIYFKTPLNYVNSPHLVHIFETIGGNAQIFMYEGVTYSSGGSDPVSPLNFFRNSPNTSKMQMVRCGSTKNGNVISWTGGTKIIDDWIGSQKNGSELKSENEMILKANTEYIFYIVAKDNGVVLKNKVSWYE